MAYAGTVGGSCWWLHYSQHENLGTVGDLHTATSLHQSRNDASTQVCGALVLLVQNLLITTRYCTDRKARPPAACIHLSLRSRPAKQNTPECKSLTLLTFVEATSSSCTPHHIQPLHSTDRMSAQTTSPIRELLYFTMNHFLLGHFSFSCEQELPHTLILTDKSRMLGRNMKPGGFDGC